MTRSEVCQLAVAQILSDPERFQSRAQYPRDVTDGDLSDVRTFNPVFAECLHAWRDHASEQVYVIDGHARLDLARRTGVETVLVKFIAAETDAEAFATGVLLNIAQWALEKDKVIWAAASRRAAVERAFHTGWLNPRTDAARKLFEFYPDLERRYRVD